MKSILLFSTFLFASAICAQSNFVSTYLENPNMNALEIHTLPWDETRLFQYTRNNLSGNTVYTIDEVAFNTISPIIPPLCSEILEIPTILDDGLLLVGSTAFGKELIYFDEVNSTVFDINSGIGGSNPKVHTIDDRVFIVASDGTNKQLFEFDKVAHSINQITNSAIPVESVCAVWGDDIFYRTKFENVSSGEDEYTLWKAELSGINYSFNSIQTINIPSTNNRMIDWRSPQLFSGNIYFMTVDVALNGSTTGTSSIGIITIDVNDQVSTTSLILPNNVGEFLITAWDGKLAVYSDLHDFFYVSNDGIEFEIEIVPFNGRFVESHVSENDKLYFSCLYSDETREVFEYDGVLLSRHLGGHLHFLSEQNNILYWAEYNQVDSSAIILVHTDVNAAEEVKVHFTFHPPHVNSSVLFGGLFTFLFGSENSFVDDNDIYQLTGSPSAGIDEKTIEFDIYPNPINAGNPLYIEANESGIGQILTADGKLIQSFELVNGTNTIETDFLSQGVYSLSFMNHTQRIIVN